MNEIEPPLLMECSGAIMTLTLNRPAAGNAINIALARALMEASIRCDEDDSIRVVQLTGAGRMFCVGGDVASFASAGEQFPSLLKELTAYLHMAVSRFARMPKPLVTVVNGAAAGAGLSLAILGDLAIASRSAKFALAYGNIGLSPDGGSTWLLPRLLGMRRAQELALTNQRITADEAAALGLITRAVDDETLAGEAAALTARLSASATSALGRTRNLLLSSFSNGLEEQLELEARAISAAGGGREAQEGLAAFIAKRPPEFSE